MPLRRMEELMNCVHAFHIHKTEHLYSTYRDTDTKLWCFCCYFEDLTSEPLSIYIEPIKTQTQTAIYFDNVVFL